MDLCRERVVEGPHGLRSMSVERRTARASVSRPKHMIVYTVAENSETVFVLRVRHHRENWKDHPIGTYTVEWATAHRAETSLARFIILDQATIAAHESPDPSDARERGTDSTKKHETHLGELEFASFLGKYHEYKTCGVVKLPSPWCIQSRISEGYVPSF